MTTPVDVLTLLFNATAVKSLFNMETSLPANVLLDQLNLRVFLVTLSQRQMLKKISIKTRLRLCLLEVSTMSDSLG